jgi:uncharacterized protein (TIGR03083 family)
MTSSSKTAMADSARAERAAHERILARLRDHAVEVRRLVAGLDEESLSRHTVPGKWSLKELLCHITRVQRVFDSRLDALLSEDNPQIAYYGPEGDILFEEMADRTAAEALDEFLAEREQLLTRLEKLSPADWHRPGRHPEFANYDVNLQMDYLAHHEAHHVYQMFQRRTPLGRVPAEG